MKFRIFILLFLLLSSKIQASISTYWYLDEQQTCTPKFIDTLPFQSFDKMLNRGLANGIYWIKVENKEAEDFIVEVASHRITGVNAYINQQEVFRLKDISYPAFQLKKNQSMYLRILCVQEAYIPIDCYPESFFVKNVQKRFFGFGLYYGFTVVIILLNLFYFFSFKEKVFLFYGIFLVFVALTLLYRDGLFPMMFSQPWLVANGELIVHPMGVIWGILFASVYLRHELHFPNLNYYAIALVGFMLLFYTLSGILNSFRYFIIAELFSITLLSMYWISGILLFRKSNFYRFFAIAYSLILFFAFDFFILPIFGLPNLGINTIPMKMASVFEMVILSYAVVYRMRILQKEHANYQRELFEHTSQIERLEEELEKLKQGQKNKITAADLNAREIEILSMIAKGVPTKEMADALFVSVNTVKYHIKNLYDKLAISSRQEAKQISIDILDVKN